jgi:hypothetical protein
MGTCSTEEMKTAHKILVGEPEGKRPNGRPRRRWEVSELTLEKQGRKLWSLFIWLSILTSGGLL